MLRSLQSPWKQLSCRTEVSNAERMPHPDKLLIEASPCELIVSR